MSLVLSTLALASCGYVKPDFVMPSEGFDTNTDISITFYHTMSQDLKDVLDLALQQFKILYPNITVNHSSIGAYDDIKSQIVTQVSSGKTEADLLYCYPDHIALYNKAKAVATLDTLIDDDKYGYTAAQKSDFVEAYYNEGKQFGDNKMYCLPFVKSSEVMYYNKTVFDENNLSVPTNWDEMETVCKTLKKIYPNSTPLGYDSSSNWFITMCEQMNIPYTTSSGKGGGHYLFNNDQAKAFVKKLKGWRDKGYITTKGLYGSYTSGLFTKTDGTQSFMCIGSSAGASYQKIDGQEVDIASIPQYDSARKAVISQGPSVTILRNDNPQKVLASWLLLKFLTTDVNFQAQFSMTSGYTPVIKSVNDNAIYKAWLESGSTNNLQALSVQQTSKQSSMFFSSPVFIGSSQARDNVGALLDAALAGSKSVDQAFQDAFDECAYI